MATEEIDRPDQPILTPDSLQSAPTQSRTETEAPPESEVVGDLLPDSNSVTTSQEIKPTKSGRWGKKRGPYSRATEVKSNEIGIKRTTRIMNMALKGLTREEISAATKVPPNTVMHITNELAGIINELNRAEEYRTHRKDLLDLLHGRLLKSMLSPEKMEKATVNQLAYASSEVHKQSRLEHGLSTSNNAVQFTKVDPKYSHS